MAMQDWKSVYSRIFWKNKREGGTPLNEANLNTSDIALKEIDNRILELRDAKFNSEDANGLVKDWNIDVATGIITVTWQNNTTEIFDLNIEKIPVNFEMSQDGIITMTTEDGSEYTADIKSVIPIYSFVGSATINVVSSVGENGEKVFTFSVVDGSIDGTKLNPDYLAEINTSVNSAQSSEQKSLEYSLLSKEYAENAKASEVKSKEYMEKAFSGTPSGYSALVDKVAHINSNLDTLEFGEVAGGKNLIDKNAIKYGYKLVGNGRFNSNSNWYVTDYVQVKPNTTYTMSGMSSNYCSEYDENKNFVNGGNKTTFTTNSNTKYVVMNSLIDGYSTPQLESGNVATPYKPYIPSVKMLAEEVNAQNESLSVIGKCKNLLKPTFKTTTRNGVTCTANGDGTYTLNGTASDDIAFKVCVINDIDTLSKLICKDSQSENFNVFCEVYNDDEFIENKYDYGDGIEIQPFSYDYKLWVKVYAGKTVTNETIKPMLTTNLNATYDDYVPYTGDGETLTHDVASLKNDLSDGWTSKTYSVGDYCIYKNQMWRCLVANSVAPSEGSNWTRVTIGSELKRIISMIN